MPLTPAQIHQLNNAIIGYHFPAVYFDFDTQTKIAAPNMRTLETAIGEQLRSQELNITKYGLANVLYWGYAQIPYGGRRVNNFMTNVSDDQIINYQALINDNNMPSASEILRCRLPEYSGMSFISKILMFLNPNDYCVLDQQLAKLRTPGSLKRFNGLTFGREETRIRITNHNETVYNGWRNECATISQLYFQGTYRVVDVERGFFNLIQQNNLANAKAIYNDA